ncbi:MAG: DISARM system phospholipase D-like protein DrmC [Planctomycetota bacterium]
MNPAEVELLTHVIACVHELPRSTIDGLVAGLTATTDWSRGLPDAQTVRAPSWPALRREAIRRACPPPRVADLMAVALAMEDRAPGRATCEVAWTGPTPPLSALRRTEQALLEVLNSARNELWLVSFAAYRVESVTNALLGAASRGCAVRVLLESPEESGGKLTSGGVAAIPSVVAACCQIYVWPKEKRPTDDQGRTGLLHAKCAVADAELLFVGSANVTEFAFERNLELGVLVRARGVAKAVANQLAWLVSTGSIQRH